MWLHISCMWLYVRSKFHRVCFCQELAKLDDICLSYNNYKRVTFFLRHSVHTDESTRFTTAGEFCRKGILSYGVLSWKGVMFTPPTFDYGHTLTNTYTQMTHADAGRLLIRHGSVNQHYDRLCWWAHSCRRGSRSNAALIDALYVLCVHLSSFADNSCNQTVHRVYTRLDVQDSIAELKHWCAGRRN